MSRTTTLQRLERILVLVPWLLEHPGVDLDEVTARFDVSRDELLRDLDVLGYCGLPGYGGGDLVEVGVVGDRVTVRLADFFRRPLTITRREALGLLLAARALAAVPGLPESADLTAALVKLEAALGTEAQVAIDLTAPGDRHLPELRRAVEQRRIVHLRYRSRSKQEHTERDVEPWALVGAGGAWYLQGWCRSAGAPRDFRLDRVVALTVTDRDAGPVPDGPPEPPAYAPAEGDAEVVLDLDPVVWWLPERLVVDRIEDRAEGAGEVRRVTLRTPELEWVARLVLARSPAVRVVSPPALAARVAVLAEGMLAHYRDPDAPMTAGEATGGQAGEGSVR